MALVGGANETYEEWAGRDWGAPDPARERLHWRSTIDDDEACAAVAERDRRLVGSTSFPSVDCRVGGADLSRRFVDPEAWRAGIGTVLLGEAIAEMTRRDFKWAELYAPSLNDDARPFYDSQGWRAGSQTRDWHGLTLIRYSLDLAIRSPA